MVLGFHECAPAHDLMHVQPESACTEYSRVGGLDAGALQLSGARGVYNLCCEVDAGGVCTSNLQPGGVYFPGERSCAEGRPCLFWQSVWWWFPYGVEDGQR